MTGRKPYRPDPARGKTAPAPPGRTAADRSTDGCEPAEQQWPGRVSVAGRMDGQQVSWSVSNGFRLTRGRMASSQAGSIAQVVCAPTRDWRLSGARHLRAREMTFGPARPGGLVARGFDR